MRQRAVILAVVVVVIIGSACQAWEFSMPDFSNTQAEAGVTLATRHLWRGFDVYPDNHSIVQPFVNLDFGDSGWGASVQWTRPNGGHFENWERIVYGIHYGGVCKPDDKWAKEWQVGWRYYNHPDGPVRGTGYYDSYKWDLDFQEFYARFRWPNLCSRGVVPRYEIIRMYISESGRRPNSTQPWSYYRHGGGWFHILGLDYDWECPWLGSPDRVLHCSADFVYNGGAGGMSNSSAGSVRNVDNDWSHMFLSVCTDVACGNSWTVTPGFGWQDSWDDSVNKSDEWVLWINARRPCR